MKKVFLLVAAALIGFQSSAQLSKNQKKYFKKLKSEKVISDPSIEWKQFGPGMSGYNEEFWCHPTDSNVQFMGPDMHVSYGTWDGGKSWHTLKDSDGDGRDMERVLDIVFSKKNPDFGVAIERAGGVYTSYDKGRTWKEVYKIQREGKGSKYTNAHTKVAINPKNDKEWLIGAGDFWNVKSNHRSLKNIRGKFNKRSSYGYVLKTTNGGKSFYKIATNISEELDVARIIYHPGNPKTIFMATNYGVFVSTNGGRKWKEANKGLPNNLPRDLTSYYNEKTGEFELYLIEQTVYEKAGNSTTAKGGVYKSTNNGKSWENITGNLYFDLSKITFTPERDRYFNTIANWFGESKKEVRSKYNAMPSKTLPVFNRLVINPTNKNEIYIAFNKKHDRTFGPGDLVKTEDGGKTWTVCARQGMYWLSGKDKAYWSSRNNPVGTNVKFAHLQAYMNNQPARSGNRMLAINSKGEVFIGIDQQTLKSSDNGNSWQQVDDFETKPGSGKWIGSGDSNLPGRFMLHETGIKGRRLLCSGEHGLWQTTDLDGWKDQQAVAVSQVEGQVHDHHKNHGLHSASTVAVHPNDPNTIYLLAWRQEHRGKLRRSTDGGKTWENISTILKGNNPSYRGLVPQYSLTIDPENPKNMYFCTIRKPIAEVGDGKATLTKGGLGFYRSFDGGYTWELSNNGFHKGASVRRIKMDPKNPKVLYAATNDNNGALYKSTNQGSSWSRVKIPSDIKAVNNVFVDRNNKNIYIATGRRNGTYEEGGVWRSKNNGKSWEQIFKAPFVWQVETSPVDQNMILISVAGHHPTKFKNPGVYLTTDGAKSWTKINKGLGQPNKIVDVKLDPYNKNVIWCASWGSAWSIAYLNGYKKGWLQD
ncbi:WD40/YVTN/BNR-like repeat-containing protein [Wenyingzhuangia sp. IMCC45574]